MRNPRFWVAAGLATLTYVVLRSLDWLLIKGILLGHLNWAHYPYYGERAVMLVGEAAISFFLTLILAHGHSTWSVRDGFQLGAYCGLMCNIMFAVVGIAHDTVLGPEVYRLLFYGIVGGIQGAIIVRVLHGSEATEENAKSEMRN
jgi:hypothetical protein